MGQRGGGGAGGRKRLAGLPTPIPPHTHLVAKMVNSDNQFHAFWAHSECNLSAFFHFTFMLISVKYVLGRILGSDKPFLAFWALSNQIGA